jgi:hypothetical protein
MAGGKLRRREEWGRWFGNCGDLCNRRLPTCAGVETIGSARGWLDRRAPAGTLVIFENSATGEQGHETEIHVRLHMAMQKAES